MNMNLCGISCIVLVAHFSLLQGTADVENSFDQELRSYEFVSPQLHNRWKSKRDISTRSTSGGHVGRATFSLSGFGKDFVLDVVQNRVLLSANYVSRYFDADGSEIISKNEKYSLPYIKLAAAPTFTDLDVQFPPTVRLSTNGPWVKILNDAKDEFEVDGAVAVFSTWKVEEEDPFNMSDIRIALKLELAE
ncbi:Disintegrin and metalloproteinase domain-containing protein 22 [Desmophyllum pertusum]|uniref:Disintegrin and metalloproteinase domain-containing protein 22 n=1 Tax=Desmophyllum pertusum TaxID=174260 RepID=A0A9X0DBA0_9CNID|nr:Disintegrin and metalloproteinase domain-containing protein 22 [Desmophyllum pertusum]